MLSLTNIATTEGVIAINVAISYFQRIQLILFQKFMSTKFDQ